MVALRGTTQLCSCGFVIKCNIILSVAKRVYQNNQRKVIEMNMLTKAAVAALMTAGVMSSDGITLTIDKVQQRYPWNGLVDIDYTVSYEGGDAPVDSAKESLQFKVINNGVSPATTTVAYSLSKCPAPTSAGSHRITWNANADGVDFVSSDVTVEISLLRYSPKYLVVDVSHLNEQGKYDIQYLDGQPANGFNQPEYKGDKIVFRLIQPGSYQAGSPSTEPGRTASNEAQHNVTISKPFYIGIFELTQKQYEYVTGKSLATITYPGDYRPVASVSLDSIRGRGEQPGSSTFLQTLRNRTGLLFDVPTEFQWQYACRAGTTTPFNDGVDCATTGDLETQMAKLGRFKLANGSVNLGGDYEEGPTTVGSYLPNAWGLYDMHGNVKEHCRDRYVTGVQWEQVDPFVEPDGTASSRPRLGGCYSEVASKCRSANRDGGAGCNFSDVTWGFRLSIDPE